MTFSHVNDAIELLEKANADLEPELMLAEDADELLRMYARVVRLGEFGVATLTRKVPDASKVAAITRTSVGKAKETVETGKVMASAPDLSLAMQQGSVSLEQAAHIARAEESSPGAAKDLLQVAESESFTVLKEKARAMKLGAEQHRDLGRRQREARSTRTWTDELGMVNIHHKFEPHVGTPIVARAEAEAQRRFRAAKKAGKPEPYERMLTDAYAATLSGSSVKGRSKRPEIVVLVSEGVARRGWKDVREGEVCKIPGVGPVAPQVVKEEIAPDAFLTGVFYDGKDLRNMKRWTKHIPVEVALALELGDPPGFDGVKCTDCGTRFRLEFDHVEPRAAGGETSLPNLCPRCGGNCHPEKTARDRKTGKFKPPDP